MAKWNQRIIRIFVCSIIFLLSLSSCRQGSPIRVGLVAQFSGQQADLGIHMRNGVELAIEEINAAGGINGRQIELIVEDDFGTPQGAMDAENKVIDEGIVAVIGHITSDQTLTGYDVAAQREVLMFSATAATAEMTGIDDLFYRTAPSTDAMGHIFASYVYDDRKIKKVAIIFDENNRSFTETWANAFSETFIKSGGIITLTEKIYSSKPDDYSKSVARIKDTSAEAVLIIASPYDTALIAQTISLQNWSPILFTTSWAQGDMLLQTGGKTVEGIELIAFFNVNDTTPELIKFKSDYKEHFGTDPIFTAMQGYETMQLLAEALQKTNGRAENLGNELLSIQDYVGLTGPVKLDSAGDVVRNLVVQKIIDGKFETVKKLEMAE